jgi:hypothetical protein
MPRKKKKKLEEQQVPTNTSKKKSLKKQIGYTLTVIFAVIAAVTLILTTIFPIFF